MLKLLLLQSHLSIIKFGSVLTHRSSCFLLTDYVLGDTTVYYLQTIDTTEHYLQTMSDYKTFTSANFLRKRFHWAITRKSNKINSEILVLLGLKIAHDSILTSVNIIFLFLGQ